MTHMTNDSSHCRAGRLRARTMLPWLDQMVDRQGEEVQGCRPHLEMGRKQASKLWLLKGQPCTVLAKGITFKYYLSQYPRRYVVCILCKHISLIHTLSDSLRPLILRCDALGQDSFCTRTVPHSFLARSQMHTTA